jgi:hypothetical protein
MKLASWMSAVVVGSLLLTGARSASASATYLGPVTTLGWVGDCSLCHTGPVGMFMTSTQPFAVTLKGKGLMGAGNTASLDAAIAALGDADSDKDGTGDLEELMTGNNPNVAGGGAVEANEPVQYGCFNSVVGRRDVPVNGVGMFASLLTAAALWRTRRRVG